MLRCISVGLGRPVSYHKDPNMTCEPGQIGQFKLLGNDVCLGISDGVAPVGILDDVISASFSQTVVDEVLNVPVAVIFDGYNWTSSTNAIGELRNSSIITGSFVVDYPGLILNPLNGTIHVPTGTIANFSTTGSAIPDAVRTTCRYAFRVPNIPGEDSTAGSGKVTIWFTRGVFQTDQFAPEVPYALNATLFVSPAGKLTTEQTTTNQPGVAMVIIPPSGHQSVLEFLWF